MDNATASGEKLAYARCFVEISVARQLPDNVTLMLDGGEKFSVLVAYEWVPPHCSTCVNFGHVKS